MDTLSREDPCVLNRGREGSLDGLVLLQGDDSLGFASKAFLEEEKQASKEVLCKPRTFLGKDETAFNGVQIRSTKVKRVLMAKGKKIDKLKNDVTTIRKSAILGPVPRC